MGRTHWVVFMFGLLLMAVLPWGCGGDDDDNNGTGGPTGEGDYEVYAGFSPDFFSDAPSEEMVFTASVERLDNSDPAATDASVEVNGNTIPLIPLASDEDEAFYMSDEITYQPGATYAVSVGLAGKTATASIQAPSYETDVDIAAPQEGAIIAPGQSLPVSWTITGQTPGKALIDITGFSTSEDEFLWESMVSGSTHSVTVPATATADWDEYEEVHVGVGVGEIFSWSGTLADEGSHAFVLLDYDMVTLYEEGGSGDEWYVVVTAEDEALEPDETTTITVTIQDAGGDPYTEGADVALSASPGATIAPTTITTDATGTATATLTAGSATAVVAITAVVAELDNATGGAVVVISDGSTEFWFVSAGSVSSMLQPGVDDTTTVWAMVEDLSGDPCEDGTTVSFSVVSGSGEVSPASATTTDGRATTVLTAGATEGTITVRAVALGDSAEVEVEVGESTGSEYMMLIQFPLLSMENPNVSPGGSTTLRVTLQTADLAQTPCPDGTEVTLTSQTLMGQTDFITFAQSTLTTVGGAAETTLTAGSPAPLGGVVTINGHTEDVAFVGGVGVILVTQ